MTRRRWTEKDDAALVKLWNAGRLHCDEIGAEIDRTEAAVRARLADLRERKVILIDRSVGGQHRGRLRDPQHAHPLVRRLVAEINRQRATKKEVAERAGVDHNTLCKWSTRHPPLLDNLEAAFNVLGFTLRPVKIKQQGGEA